MWGTVVTIVLIGALVCYCIYIGYSPSPLENAKYYQYKRDIKSSVETRQNFEKAKLYYARAIRMGQIKGLVGLAKLYHEGIPDQYDNKGIKIAGVKPNIHKAIEYYSSAYEKGYYPVLLDLAGIYHWGNETQNFPVDTKKAKELYYKLSREGDPYYRSRALDRLKQMSEEYSKSVGLRGIIPEPAPKKGPVKPPERRIVEAENVKNDTQNVHDHSVVNSVKNSLDKLQNTTKVTTNIPISLIEIRNYINTANCSSDRKKDAIKALDSIEKSDREISFAGMRELDALHLVWNRVKNNYIEAQQDTYKENLLNELSECVEHGKVICSTGRFNRIVDTLNNALDPDIHIVPEWMIAKEIMDKIGSERNIEMKKMSSVEVDALNVLEPSKEQQKIVNEFNDKFKKNITDIFHKEYVSTGIMSENRLNAEIKKYMEFI